LKDGGGDGTTLLVNVGEELGSHTTSSKSLNGASRGEGGAVGDTDDGNSDHSVEDGGEDFDTSEADSDDEGRVLRVGTVGVEKVGVAGGNNETKDEEADDVEESDTPEDLLDSLRKSLSGVGGFSGCETDQLSTTEGKGGSNEYTAEALEAIAECLPIAPISDSDVSTSVGRNTANIDNNAENDETNACHDLDDGENEFNLTVGSHAQELDSALLKLVNEDELQDRKIAYQSNQEDGNPHTDVDVSSSFPELDGDRGGCQLERKNSQPLNGVLPTNCEAPRL
jgi:hypothetical protein